MKFTDKVAIVTGGSRGIGNAIVEKFVKKGASVVLCASREETADKAVAALKEKYPEAAVEGIWPTLTDSKSVEAAFAQVKEKFGHIDILVNNAGTADSTPFDQYTEEKFDQVMDLNVKAMYNCSRAVVPYMEEQKSGVIINISSMVSINGQPSGIAYPTSKFAVNGFTISLARELGPKGIRVDAVAPGITYTDMMRQVPKNMIDPLVARIPLQRLGEAEDIANAVLFLASDKASYITGTVLNVDGAMRV
jgi:3-oxoacyl-[acyl-carrier protein] reductase/7-alpha-hydroxysteroid dehydrogenase